MNRCMAHGCVLVAGAFLALTLWMPHVTASDQVNKAYYNGKTVEWIVATTPGGGHDYWGRLVAANMQNALPGSKFVIRNRPGAGHIIGANLIYAARPDGLTIGNFTTGLAYTQLINTPGIRFDLAKMSWVGKVSSERRVMSVAANSEFKTFEDILNAKREVKFSASGVGSGSFTDSFMIASAFNIPYRIINGYSGSQAALAMVRGEIDVLMGGEDSADTFARAGHIRTIMIVGGNPPPGMANAVDYAKTPHAQRVVRLMARMGDLSRIIAGPPDVPPDRLAALRAAFREAMESKELQEAAVKAQRGIEPAYGEDVQKMIVELMDQPPEIVAMLKNLSEMKDDMVQHMGPVTEIKDEGREIFVKHQGNDVGAKISGSRTKITLDGKEAKRTSLQKGMTCTFTYAGPGQEAERVDCKN